MEHEARFVVSRPKVGVIFVYGRQKFRGRFSFVPVLGVLESPGGPRNMLQRYVRENAIRRIQCL